MRTTLLALGALAGLASANINFEWVNPTCDFASVNGNRCLTGQHCTAENMYVLQPQPSQPS